LNSVLKVQGFESPLIQLYFILLFYTDNRELLGNVDDGNTADFPRYWNRPLVKEVVVIPREWLLVPRYYNGNGSG